MSLLPTVKSVGEDPDEATQAAAEAQFMQSIRAVKLAGSDDDNCAAPAPIKINPKRRVRGDSFSLLPGGVLVGPEASPASQARNDALDSIMAQTYPPPPHTFGPIVVVSSCATRLPAAAAAVRVTEHARCCAGRHTL